MCSFVAREPCIGLDDVECKDCMDLDGAECKDCMDSECKDCTGSECKDCMDSECKDCIDYAPAVGAVARGALWLVVQWGQL